VRHVAEHIGIPERTLRRHYPGVFAAAELRDGRKPFEPTEQQRMIVRMAAGVGYPHAEIATLVGVSRGTMAKYFREELSLGAAEANLKVGAHLLKMATGDPTNMTTVIAAIWWSKARMGWSDASRIENAGAATAAVNGRPQVVVVRSDHDGNVTEAAQSAAAAALPVMSDVAVVRAALTCRQDDQGLTQRPT
jgi:AcrR family transcriptional regulator